MNSKIVWFIARHEMRVHRRLARTHVFIWIALVVSALYFLIVTLVHMLDAVEIAMLGVVSPRYIMSLLSGSFLALFCAGLLIQIFDQLNRDEINRIREVMLSKPISNFELFIGRLIGVTILLAVPLLLFLALIITYGMLAELFSFQVGEPVEVWSVVSFSLFDIVPNFLIFGSFLILLNSIFKSRLLALSLTLACLVGTFWLTTRLPLDISKPIQTVSGNVLFPSELIPTLITPVILCNRFALVLVAVGFLYWASKFDGRESSSNTNDLVSGTVSFCCGLLIFGAMFTVQTFERDRITQWIQFHDEHFIPTAFPDIEQIRGGVTIKPGRKIALDLTLDVNISANRDIDFVLFSLNPDYHISHLSIAGVEVSDHKFRHGLLKIPRHYFNSETTELAIVAQGRPDKRFAYLDSRDTLTRIVGPDVRQLRQLGTESLIFHSKFVALLPGTKWYPTSGTATQEDDWEHRERDFFTLDLEVSVPRNWSVAGPARRKSLSNGERTVYLFQQSTPLPEFALVASNFESATIDVEGITFELLYSNAHRNTFQALKLIENNIQERVKAIIDSVRAQGFDYPYESFAIVEVPSTLRVFGGGLSMNSVMCPPGIVMIRESTLPTISVNSLIDGRQKTNFKQNNWDQQVWNDWQFQAISRYLQHPMFESNVNFGFFRSLFFNQTHATQEGAHALNDILEHMIGTLFPNAEASFDFQHAINRNILNIAQIEPLKFLRFHSREGFHTKFDEMQKKKQVFLNVPTVWDRVKEMHMYDPVVEESGFLTSRATSLRSRSLVKLLEDSVGIEKLAQITLDLTNRFRGESFTLEEFNALITEHGVELNELAGDLIGTAGLPGFIGTNQTSQQRELEGTTKFETSFLLENGEPVSGPVQLSVGVPFLYGSTRHLNLQPIVVKGNQTIQITVESLNPVKHIEIKPYLSLNRMNIRLDLPQATELLNWEFVRGEAPFIKSVEVVSKTSALNSSITVDDLDLGFSIDDRRIISGLFKNFGRFVRQLLGEMDVPQDNGLLTYQLSYRPKTKIWSRWTDPTAIGTYRRTFAISEAGDGRAVAKFSATLPKTGAWKLEYYLPKGNFFEEVKQNWQYDPTTIAGVFSMTSPHPLGTFNLKVQNGTTMIDKTLQASALTPGWQDIGDFDLTDSVVAVLVSNKTDKPNMYVIADAIRWTPVENDK